MNFFTYQSGKLFCEGVDVDSLALRYGTPLYVYSTAAFSERYAALVKAFESVQTMVAFSVKSCSNIAILKVLSDLGSGFDVVSGGELSRALHAGGANRKVVFAGVGKSDDEIRYALDADILMLNVESEAELDVIQNIAAEMGTVAPVALRINPDVDAHTHEKTTTGKKENKFGIDFATASRIVRNIAVQPNVRLIGLDVHIGSPVNSTEPYDLALGKLADFVREHRSPRAQFEYLNVGGGFGLLYRDEVVPSFQEYAGVITPHVKRAGCKLIIEPGRSISGNAGVLITKVLYLKDNGHRHFTIVDGGMTELVRPALYGSYHFCWPTRYIGTPPSHLFGSPEALEYCNREEMEVESGVGRGVESEGLMLTDVVGPICESSDYFAKGRRLPQVERGHNLAVFSAGAYGFSMSSNYNSRLRAAEVLVDGGEARVIRERETFESMIQAEHV